METTARVYVGTYNKYNNGDLTGAWINVFDYTSQDDFLEIEGHYFTNN